MSVKRTAKSPLPAMKPLTFTHPHLVFVEGADDAGVLECVIEKEQLSGFHLHDMQGKGGWNNSIKVAALDPGFVSNVRSVGLVVDADTSATSAYQRCLDILKDAGLPLPEDPWVNQNVVTKILVLPDGSAVGAIEDLFLAFVDEDRRRCVDAYFSMLRQGGLEHCAANVMSKAQLQTYLAGMPTVARNLAGAVRMGVFDLEHAALEQVRRFIHSLYLADR